MEQERLDQMFEDEEERIAARTLAERYARVLWPRRIILREQRDICRLRPQFAGDPDPYGLEAEP
jgi:hypothetical protein